MDGLYAVYIVCAGGQSRGSRSRLLVVESLSGRYRRVLLIWSTLAMYMYKTINQSIHGCQ